MAEAYSPSRFRAGLVKCALVAGLVLWAVPAQAQIKCAPAEIVATFLEENGLRKTASVAMMDGDELEAFESETTILIVILVKDQDAPMRCLVRELPVTRSSRGA